MDIGSLVKMSILPKIGAPAGYPEIYRKIFEKAARSEQTLGSRNTQGIHL